MLDDLARRLAAHGLTLSRERHVTHGYVAEWRLDGLGAPARFGTLAEVGRWASKHLRDTTAQDNDMTTTTLIGDNREHLQTLPDRSVHLVVTSPPYFGLRTYGDDAREIGREPTPDAYIAALVDVFRQVRRVLRDDGVLVVNLGDSFNNDSPVRDRGAKNFEKTYTGGKISGGTRRSGSRMGIPHKSKLLIPHRVALALQADGWIVRQDFAWLKRNVMPESVTDRPTTAHEYLFLLAKSARYFWDADAVRQQFSPNNTIQGNITQGQMPSSRAGKHIHKLGNGSSGLNNNGRNYRTTDTFFASLDSAIADARAHLAYLETIRERGGLMLDEGGDPLALLVNPKPYKESHFAVFPETLVEPFIRAGSPQQCCPTCGAGWVRQVEKNNPRNSEEYRAIQDTPKSVASGGLAGRGTKTTGLAKPGWREFPPEQRIDLGFAPGCACPNNDGSGRAVVLDPFSGSGTVGMVAERLGRDAVLIELHATYAPLQDKRLNGVQVEMPLDAA